MSGIAPCLYIALVGGQTLPTVLGLLLDGRGPRPGEPHREVGDYPVHVHLLPSAGTKRELNSLASVLPIDRRVERPNEVAGGAWATAGEEQRRLDLQGQQVALTATVIEPYQVARVKNEVLDTARRFLTANSGGRVRVDVTGGTKTMSIGAYLAGMDLIGVFGERVELVYVATETHRYISYPATGCDQPGCGRQAPPGAWCEHNRFAQSYPELRVGSWLASYGYAFLPEQVSPMRPPAAGDEWRDAIAEFSLGILNSPERFSAAREIRRQALDIHRLTGIDRDKQDRQQEQRPRQVLPPLDVHDAARRRAAEEAATLGLLAEDRAGTFTWGRAATKQERNLLKARLMYWEGGWLEHAVAAVVMRIKLGSDGAEADGAMGDVLLQRRFVSVHWDADKEPNLDPQRAADGEIDVATVRGSHLILIECKDVALGDQRVQRDLKRDIDKVSSQRNRLGGRYAAAYLLTVKPLPPAPDAAVAEVEQYNKLCADLKTVGAYCRARGVRLLEAEAGQALEATLRDALQELDQRFVNA